MQTTEVAHGHVSCQAQSWDGISILVQSTTAVSLKGQSAKFKENTVLVIHAAKHI